MAMNLAVVEGTGEVVGRRVSDAVNRAPEAIGTLPRVRLTGILVEDGHVLVQRQVLKERAHWSFPGGPWSLARLWGSAYDARCGRSAAWR